MAQGNETATFRVDIEGNAADKAAEAADAMEEMRKSISAGRSSLREMSGALKNLTGDTDEVKAAQNSLKASIDAEKAALSASTLEMLKQQKAYGSAGGDAKKLAAEKSKLADKVKAESATHKKLADDLKKNGTDEAAAKSKALGAAITTAGGPVAMLRDKLSGLKDIMGEGGAGGASSLLTAGLGGLITVAVGLAVAMAAAAYSVAKFVIKGADAARSVGLLREAAMGGNAQWGKNFGEQVDALSKQVPTSKEQINELGLELARSRIGGQVWVDTLSAVTQASAALGDGAGNKLKDFVTRAREFGRFRLDPREMVGTGVEFKEVAEALSKSMHVGVKEAQAALFEGRVSLGDGAKALKDAVEKKLGKINLRQMLSLDNLVKKLGESFDELTTGVDLEPMLAAFKDLANVFSLSTVSGQGLKQLITVLGGDLTKTATGGAPLLKQAIYGLIMAAQEMTISYLQVRNVLRDTFGDSKATKNINGLKIALEAGKFAAYAVATSVALLGVGLAVAAAPFVWFGKVVYDVLNGVNDLCVLLGETLRDTFANVDWKATGHAIVDGLIAGLNAGGQALIDTVSGLGGSIKKTFRETLRIHSPSKVFEEYGKNTTAGFEQGVEAGSPGAQSAVSSMVSAPSGGGGRGGALALTVNIYASGGNAKEVAAAVSSSSIIEQLTQAVIDAVHGSGAGVPG